MRAATEIPVFPQCEATHPTLGVRCLRGAEHVGIHVGPGPVDWGNARVDSGGKKTKVSDPNAPAWLVYRPGKGYFWGPKHPRAGEPAVFGIYE